MKEPKIRFKGFRGEWEIEKIGNFSTSFSGGTPTAGVPAYYGGNIPFIRSGEIHEDKTELSLTEKGYNNSSAKIVEIGTLLYALYGATSGDVAISKIQGAINQAILAITPYKLVETDFLADFLLCNKNKIVGELLQGGQGNLSGSLVKDINVAYPCISEQQSISSYFQHLDSLIQSTTKKIESLKQVKAASLQSMFPQVGETTPRVRFKGFKGEWEKVLIGKMGVTYSGLSGKTKDDFGFGEARFITFLNVLTNAKINTSILEPVNVNRDEHQNEVRKGDLLFNTSSETPEEVGMCAVMDEELEKVYLNSFCFGFRVTDNNIDPTCVAYMMRSHIGRLIMSILAQGATRYNLSKNSFCKAVLVLPKNIAEQRAIASYFTTLDSQITLQTQRLEKLKQIKSACLDNMFV